MDDLDPALFDKARALIRGYRSDHPWLTLDNEALLKSSSLRVEGFYQQASAREILYGGRPAGGLEG